MIKDPSGVTHSPYGARFCQYIIFKGGHLYRFAISYKFDTSPDAHWHRMVFCRDYGERVFFPITVMLDSTASAMDKCLSAEASGEQ